MSATDLRQATAEELAEAQLQDNLPPLSIPQSNANHEDSQGDGLLEPGDFEEIMETSEDTAPIEFSDDEEEGSAASEPEPEPQPEPQPEPVPEPESNDGDDTGGAAANDDDAGSGSEADSEDSDAEGASEDEDEDEGAPAAESDENDGASDDEEDGIAPTEPLSWPGLNEVDLEKTKYAKIRTRNPDTQKVTRVSNTRAILCVPEAVRGDAPGSNIILFVDPSQRFLTLSKAPKARKGLETPKSAETVSDDEDGSSAAGAAAATENNKQVAPMLKRVNELQRVLFRVREAAQGAEHACPGEFLLQTDTSKPTSTTTMSMDPTNNCGRRLSPKERNSGDYSDTIPAKLMQITAIVIKPDGSVLYLTLTIAFIPRGLSPFEKMRQVAQIQQDIDAWATDVMREFIGDQMVIRLPTSCTKSNSFLPTLHEPLLNAIKRLQFTCETRSITAEAEMYTTQQLIVSGAADHFCSSLTAMIGANTTARNPDDPLPSKAAIALLATTLQKTVGTCQNALLAMTESQTPPDAQTKKQISDILKSIESACIGFDRNDCGQLKKPVKRLVKNLGRIATATDGAFVDAGELKALKNTGAETLEDTWTAVKRYYVLKEKLEVVLMDEDDEHDPAEDDGAAADELDPDVEQATEADRKRVDQKAQEVANQLVDNAKGGMKVLIDTRFDTVMGRINEMAGDDPETQLATTKIMLQRMQDFAQKEAARKKAVAVEAKAKRAERQKRARQKLEKLEDLGAQRSTRSSARSTPKRPREELNVAEDGPGASKRKRAQAEAKKRPFPQPATADPAKRPRRH